MHKDLDHSKEYTRQEWIEKWNLDEYEQDLLVADEERLLVPLSSEEFKKEKAMLVEIAKITLKKINKMPISIRLTEADLNAIKELAKKEGLPYQTFIGSILHKYISGQIC